MVKGFCAPDVLDAPLNTTYIALVNLNLSGFDRPHRDGCSGFCLLEFEGVRFISSTIDARGVIRTYEPTDTEA